MRLVRTGTWSEIHDVVNREAIKKVLDRHLSYKMPGAMWVPAYQSRGWDGRVSLVKRVRGGPMLFPSGFWAVVQGLLTKAGATYSVGDGRGTLRRIDPGPWRGPALRPYQVAAVQAVADAGGGILAMPVRSGKTLTAARIILLYGLRSLFVVTSDLLLHQTVEAIATALPQCHVSEVGEGSRDDSGEVVVATMQTLSSLSETDWFRKFAKSFSLIFMDECHHLDGAGDAWRNTALSLDGRIKVGLSATVNLDRVKGEPVDPPSVWLEGVCGPIVYSRTMSWMIENGYLTPPLIRFINHSTPVSDLKGWSKSAYTQLVTECAPRNQRIVEETMRYVREGKRVLIDVSRVGHARLLGQLLRAELPPGKVAVLVGSTKAKQRAQALAAYRAGTLPVIVGTILGEGIDIPELEVVINGEGGAAHVSTIQRLRNLTAAAGKTGATVIEMVDLHHPKLRAATVARLDIYGKEPAFKFEFPEL